MEIIFYSNTTVTRIELIDDNLTGFKNKQFNCLLDNNEEYEEHDVVGDVIGTVVGIGDIIAVNSDGSSERIDLTFWDSWAKKWNQYAEKLETIGRIDLMLMLGKVKFWNNTPAVHNALFGTKLFINRQLPELISFCERYEAREEFDANEHKIQLFAPEIKVVSPAEFRQAAVKKLVGSIWGIEPKVDPVASKWPTSSKAKQLWFCSKCEKTDTQVASRYKMIVKVMDESDSAQLIFYSKVYKMTGFTALELIEKYRINLSAYFPNELNGIIRKQFMFRMLYSEYNYTTNSYIYRCEKVSEDEEIVSHWKKGLGTLGEELNSE
ncbi:replication protein A 70 kDa DNA-binding subunit B, partial [Tanacetum coccineum]